MGSSRSITSEGFAALLNALGETPRDAGAHYEELRTRLIFFFTRRSLPCPEDLADEVLDRLARRLEERVDIQSAEAFALGIARLVAFEQFGKARRTEGVDHTFWNNVPAPLPTQSNEERLRQMERCLKRLPPSEAKLLRSYYVAGATNLMRSRQTLAEKLGVSSNALRQKVFLVRQSLAACMTAAKQPKA